MDATPDKLRRLSELLDQAFDLAEPARAAWLDSLQGDAATFGATLRELLARHAARETGDLLERLPAFTAIDGDAGPAAAFAAGDSVGAYRLKSELGRGGMGEVWRAERSDGQLKRDVALKLPMLAARRGLLVQRFARERDILGSLAHPNIARLYDAGLADDGQPYLALELVEGEPIAAYCATHGLDARARVRLLRQVMQAVQYAHAHLVIHRDLKPSNVLVTAEGQAMLLDFGIAKLLQGEREAGAPELTQLGERALTLHYAAPEQLTGAPVSIATDVWALGVLLYELLAERRPFEAASPAALEQAVLHADPPPLRQGPVARLPGRLALELENIARKALKKEPAARYETATALADDLGRWLAGEPVRAQGDSAWYRARKFVGRNRLAVGAAAAAATLVLGAGGVSLWQAQEARAQTRIAQAEARTSAAVQAFLQGIFGANSGDQADPARARLRTARELLDAGAERIGHEFDDAPEAKLRVLRTLVDLYTQLGEPEPSVALQRQAAALAARAWGEGNAEQIKSLAELGDVLSQLGRSDEAAQVLAQAAALLRAHPDRTGESRLALDLALATHHNYRNDGLGLDESQRAVATLRARGASKELVSALAVLGSLHYNLRQYAQSRDVLQETLAIAARLPGAGASERAFVLVNLADAQMRLGEVAPALAHYREAAEHSAANQGPAGRDTVMMMGRWGQALLIDGQLAESLRVLGAAGERALGWSNASHKSEAAMFVLANEARAAMQFGDPQRALDRLAHAEAVIGADDAQSPVYVSLLLYRARALSETGRFSDSARAIDAAQARVQRDGHGRNLQLGVAKERVHWLIAQGRSADAQAAWDALEAAGGAGDPDGGNRARGHAERAEVLLAAGRTQDALAQTRLGLDALAAAPAWGQKVDRARLTLLHAQALVRVGQVGQAAQALAAAEQALALAEDHFDRARSPHIALALLTLAEARLAAGQRDAALAQLARAAALLGTHPQLGPTYAAALARVRALAGARG